MRIRSGWGRVFIGLYLWAQFVWLAVTIYQKHPDTLPVLIVMGLLMFGLFFHYFAGSDR